jgi:hypothetical protein
MCFNGICMFWGRSCLIVVTDASPVGRWVGRHNALEMRWGEKQGGSWLEFQMVQICVVQIPVNS